MFMKVFTHHEIIYRIPICVHNKNCGIMRTYIPCYIRSEEKVPLTQNCSKTQLLNKRNTYLLNMLSAISFISVFYYSTSCVALLNKSVSGQLPPGQGLVQGYGRNRVVGQYSSRATSLEPIKKVDICEELYSQQLIYRRRSNP